MPLLGRRFVAELIGTFTLVFFGCAAVITNAYPGANFGLLGIAWVHAIALAIGVTMAMNISGGHCNPAISAGLLAARRIDLKTFGVHLAAQVVAAVLAAVLLKVFFPASVADVVSYGLPKLDINVTRWQGMALEALLTFFLMSAVYGTVVAPTAPRVGGFGVGLSLFFLIMIGGPLTGAAMNPARALAPAIAGWEPLGQAIYWIGPILGAIAAALVWEYFLIDRKATASEK